MTPVRVLVAGDVFPNLSDGLEAFEPLREVTCEVDLVVGNCEGVYSDGPSPAPSHKSLMIAPPDRGSMLGAVPFHVMSLANNHMMDGGYNGLSDTVELLSSQGILTVGAGPTLAEAARPLLVECYGQRLGFVAVCSVFPVGYEASDNRPGISALRVRTFYADPDRNFWEPGIAPAITTMPDSEDLERFRNSIAMAKEAADSVVALCHWGYSRGTDALLDYEIELARDAVVNGADAVICAHHHSLRGIEMYRDRPIFYGMGTLVHHLHRPTSLPGDAHVTAAQPQRSSRVFDSEYPYFPFEKEARMSGFAALDFCGGEIVAVGVVPAAIRPDGTTELLRPDSEELATYLEHLRTLCIAREFDTVFRSADRSGWAFVQITKPSRPGVVGAQETAERLTPRSSSAFSTSA